MRVRLLPWSVADGPTNMARDEVLLDSAIQGVASLRFYGWAEATLSLGYFQSAAVARAYPGLEPLPWVRRHSGGAALVHQRELTYALALPAGSWQSVGESWIVRFHRLIQQALRRLGVETLLCDREKKLGDVLCFRHHTPGDLLLFGHKIVGSAQRKRHGALLQHGGILLAQSEYTPELPGLAELTARTISGQDLQAALLEAFDVTAGDWTEDEQQSIPERIAARYGSPSWNGKR